MKKNRFKCPRCGRETFWQGNSNRPFCSDKCRQIDLGRWSNEEYAISSGDVDATGLEDEEIF